MDIDGAGSNLKSKPLSKESNPNQSNNVEDETKASEQRPANKRNEVVKNFTGGASSWYGARISKIVT